MYGKDNKIKTIIIIEILFIITPLLYLLIRVYQLEQDNIKLDNLWSKDWEDLKKQYNKTDFLKRENINLKGEIKSIKVFGRKDWLNNHLKYYKSLINSKKMIYEDNRVL